MKVKITRGVIVTGLAACVGDVVEVDEFEAGFLVSIGKAELYVAPKVKDTPPVDPPPKIPTGRKMKKSKVVNDD
ncbi:hypothetical protein DRH27_05475 [Candidatus Falkowbacteria bacterium]|nr:MAG: hypothetical protein DRH27_05475 [Candidatus Falkowbacteria bacterium]